jgi:hypothetical protein
MATSGWVWREWADWRSIARWENEGGSYESCAGIDALERHQIIRAGFNVGMFPVRMEGISPLGAKTSPILRLTMPDCAAIKIGRDLLGGCMPKIIRTSNNECATPSGGELTTTRLGLGWPAWDIFRDDQ